MWFLEKTEEQKQENIGITAFQYIRSNELSAILPKCPPICMKRNNLYKRLLKDSYLFSCYNRKTKKSSLFYNFIKKYHSSTVGKNVHAGALCKDFVWRLKVAGAQIQ